MRKFAFLFLALPLLFAPHCPAQVSQAGTNHAPVNFVAPLALEDEHPYQVLQADVNGDGLLDLITIDFHTANVYLNQGNGQFAPAQTLTANPPAYYSAALGDFNGDGILDLALLGYYDQNSAHFFLLLGNGQGGFEASDTPAATGEPNKLLVGDFNGDGHLDVAVLSDTIQVFPGNGAGGFGAPISSPLPDITIEAVTADFNGDGKLDLALRIGTVTEYTSLAIYTGAGDGTFTPGATIPDTTGAPGLQAADVNGDGKPDLVAGFAGSAGVGLGNGDGTLSTRPNTPRRAIRSRSPSPM